MNNPIHKLSTVPEPGQLVEVRRRQWVVSEVIGSLMSSIHNPQHLVILSSIDEDALGEEIEVIWELEPGAQIIERAGLPEVTGWDTAERMDAFLDAVRWGAVTNADRSFLQAPFRSGVTIEDYQLDPLVRALDMARVNLLIADDVGLGKTIEAGLVIQELLIRHRARSVLVICPAGLQVKWQTEMQEKFGLEFRIVDTDYIRKLRRERGIHTNPWTSFPRLITSMDWMKKTLPVLDAAHIRPYSLEGPHDVANGLLLRQDVHTLFDRGCITVNEELRIEVSRRIKEDYGNGREYYAMHGKPLAILPDRDAERPSKEYLLWHNENVYLA